MQEPVRVTGMVLEVSPVGETDRRVVLLTKERGKISAFARGARKQGSRLMAATNPFCFGEFILYEGRNSYSLSEAVIRNYFEDMHTTQGGQLLERIPQMRELPFFTYAYDIAKYHHERWDGRGYPEGRKGDDIPLWAQIVSIADVYDALVSPRCYKKAFSFEVALGMIVSGECGVFNPNILACFREIEGKLRTLYGSGPERLYE